MLPANLKIVFMILVFTSGLLHAQRVTIKPYFGHLFPKMTDVNKKIGSDIDGWRDNLEAPIPDPGEFNGENLFGGQLEYHMYEDLFFIINFSIYNEEVATSFSTELFDLNYERDAKMVDIVLNLHFYFNYNSWKRFNKYVGLGVGLIFVEANSQTFSNHPVFFSDSKGNFSGNTLTAVLLVGGDLRLSRYFRIWTEGGIQVANIGQLDGKVTTSDNSEKLDFTSVSSFDFTGLVLRAGLGISLPFLQ